MSILRPHFVCRPALAMDTAAALALSSLIWDGEDYIRYVWDEWLADPDGLLAVGEYDGRLISIAKLTHQYENSWWFEGLRIHPDFEKHGFASHMFDYMLSAWEGRGGQTARLLTTSFRIAVHKMCAKRGFVKIADNAPFGAAPLAVEGEEAAPFCPMAADEAAAAVTLAGTASAAQLTGGLMDIGWAYCEANPEHLGEAIAAGQAWWWQGPAGRRGALSLWLDDEDDEKKRAKIGLLACELEDLPALLRDVRRLGAQQGYDEVGWLAPLRPEIGEMLTAQGYARTWDASVFLFEKIAQVMV